MFKIEIEDKLFLFLFVFEENREIESNEFISSIDFIQFARETTALANEAPSADDRDAFDDDNDDADDDDADDPNDDE